jgi:hypothetical protein
MIKELVVRSYEKDKLFAIELDQFFFYALKNAYNTTEMFEKNLINWYTVNIFITNNIKVCIVDPEYLEEFEDGDLTISETGLEYLLLNENDLYDDRNKHWTIIEYPNEDYLIHPEYDKYYQYLSVYASEVNKRIIFQGGAFHIDVFDNEADSLVSVSINYLDFIKEVLDEIDNDFKPFINREEPLTKYYKRNI